MPPYINLHPIGPDTDPAHFQAMLRANTDAVEMNNMGNLARRHGQLDRALALHLGALDLKIRGFGEESVQAALSFNTLGETYIELAAAAASHGADGDADKRSYTDAAEHALRKALHANDDRALGGLEMGPRGDAAVARDNLARALELKGAMGEARAMRLRGLKAGRVLCGSDKVRRFAAKLGCARLAFFLSFFRAREQGS